MTRTWRVACSTARTLPRGPTRSQQSTAPKSSASPCGDMPAAANAYAWDCDKCARCGSKRAADDTALTSEQVSRMRRELELSRMRESELRLEVQQLVARNRELELQLKVYNVTPPTLRGAEAEGSHRQARWCAPSFRMACAAGLAPALLLACSLVACTRSGTSKCGTTIGARTLSGCDEAVSISRSCAIRFFFDAGSKDSTWLIEQTDAQQE
jgi:hypothetical protein